MEVHRLRFDWLNVDLTDVTSPVFDFDVMYDEVPVSRVRSVDPDAIIVNNTIVVKSQQR